MASKHFRKFPNSFPAGFCEAVSDAYSALFEAGGSPQKKTRKMIRRVLPEPPGGWDSPARDDTGEEFTSQAGNVLTWDQVLETYIRGLFFRNSGIPEKFEPAAARIAYTELGEWPEDLEDFRTDRPAKTAPGQFRAILRMLGGSAHVDEYDWDLNGLTYAEMLPRFGRNAAESEKDDTEDTGHLNYEIERIENFDKSRQFSRFTDWCICNSKEYWNRYTSRGKYTTYFLMKPGFDELSSARGENYPHDEYSLSLIGLMVGPEGDIEYCCLRRNHEGGMGDHELSEKQISQLLGRPARTVLTYQEPVDDNPVPRLAARIKAGESIEEVYGGKYTEVFANVRRYSVNDDYVLVNTDTGLPIVDFAVSWVESIDSMAALVSYASGDTDDYGDDITIQALVRPDGRMYDLGHSRCYNDAYYNTYFDWPVNTVQRLWLPGLYLVDLDIENEPDQVVIMLKDGDGIVRVSQQHDGIEFYPEDRIMVCDPDSEEWDSFGETGEPEIIRVNDNREVAVLLSSDKHDQPEHILVYDTTLPAGTVNILYDSGEDDPQCTLYLVHDGGTEVLAEDIGEYGWMDEHEGLAYIEMSDGSYSVYSLEECRFVAENLAGKPDDSGIYATDDGRKNLISKRGNLFGEPVADLNYIGGLTATPIGSKMRGHYFAVVTLDDGNISYVDVRDGKPLYDRPLPPKSYPYSDTMVVREMPVKTEDGNATEVEKRSAIFTIDGERRSDWFDRFTSNPAYVSRGEGEAAEYNVIDPETGKLVFEDWLAVNPVTLGMSWADDPHGDSYYLVKATRKSDGKSTLLKATCPIFQYSDEGYGHEYPRFSDTGIGWHRHVEKIANAGGCAAAQDFPGNYEAKEGEDARPHLLTTLYDFRAGRSAGPFPTPLAYKALEAMAEEYAPEERRKYVSPETAIAMAIGTCPDWTGYVDNYCKEHK